MAASEADRVLHRRLLDGDVTATAEAAERFLDLVAANLRRRFPKLRDADLLDDAAADAIYSFLTVPDRYRPEKGGLAAYLTMSAAGDLKNKLAAERHRSEKRTEIAVELLPDGRKEEENAEPTATLPPLAEWLAALFDDPADRTAAAMVLEGVRSTDRFAAVYGLSDLPPAERRRLVKRHKDRIKKVLERHGAEVL